MKLNLVVLTIATVLLTSTSFASITSTNDIHPPFIKREVPAKGLKINYDLRSAQDESVISQKLVCIFEGFTGNVTYMEDNTEKSNQYPFYNQEIYFTGIGKTWVNSEGLDSIDQYHVDSRGSIKLENSSNSSKHAYATCFYQSESAK